VVEKAAPKANKKPKKKVKVEDLSCPKCKAHQLVKGKTAYGCGNFRACGFKLPFEVFGKKLTAGQVQDLIQKGKTRKIKGLTTAEGQDQEAKIVLDGAFGVQLEA